MEQAATLDKILQKYVGGAGKYQIFTTFIMAWVYWAGLYALFITNFTTHVPDHRCRVPQCELENQTKVAQGIDQPNWLVYAIPPETNAKNFFSEKKAYDSCQTYQRSGERTLDPKVVSSTCFPEDFDDNITIPCQDYIFEAGYFEETLTTKLNLVCEKDHLRSLLGTIMIISLGLGSLTGGRIGDKIGRKKAIFGAILLLVPSIISAGYVNHYAAYGLFHFISMACLPVIWVNCYVYSTEIFTPQWRYIFIGLFELPFGYYIFNLIAYLNSTWTQIHLWTGIVTALILPVYLILPESVRWLAQNNQEDEAMEVLSNMAKINGKELDKEDLGKVREMVNLIAEESHQTEDKLTPLDMFKKGHCVQSCILVLAWITACISFYALSLNSSDLAGDIMLNFFLSRTSGFGVALGILLIANKLGRVKSLVASHTILGLGCIGLAFIPKEKINILLTVYVLASIFASISFNLVYLMTCEMYPTNLRAQAVGSASTISRIFCACAPFLKPLAKFWQPLPMIVIAIPILISAALSMKLPETFRKELPQTMKNAKDLEMDDKKINTEA